MNVVVFRDLPGIADLELMLVAKAEGRLRGDELQLVAREIDQLSTRLFGITEADTRSPPWPDGPIDSAYVARAEEWESCFAWLYGDYTDAEDAFWQAIGIDMSASEDEYLECLDVFGRQIVCAARRLLPAASFRFRPSDPLTDDQILAAAEAWGRDLQSR